MKHSHGSQSCGRFDSCMVDNEFLTYILAVIIGAAIGWALACIREWMRG